MHDQDPARWARRLEELDLSRDLFYKALDQAVVDVRGCTSFDAPGMPGFTFWSRTNRYIAEDLHRDKWIHTAKDSILRMIHPSRSHAVTAMSASGAVGDLEKPVRSKNPKGSAMARLVERNGQIPLLTADEVLYGCELDDIPTWCLLYKRVEGAIVAEFSLPVKMNGKYINEWKERILLDLPGLGDPGANIEILDDSGDGVSPEVVVEALEDR